MDSKCFSKNQSRPNGFILGNGHRVENLKTVLNVSEMIGTDTASLVCNSSKRNPAEDVGSQNILIRKTYNIWHCRVSGI